MLPIINNFPINSIKSIKIVYKTKKNIYEKIVLIFSLHLNKLNLKTLRFILKNMKAKLSSYQSEPTELCPLQKF